MSPSAQLPDLDDLVLSSPIETLLLKRVPKLGNVHLRIEPHSAAFDRVAAFDEPRFHEIQPEVLEDHEEREITRSIAGLETGSSCLVPMIRNLEARGSVS